MKLLARYLADFNTGDEWRRPTRWEWLNGEPGLVSTLILIAVVFAVTAFFCWR